MAAIANVFVLFTDLVGSTELAAELSHQAADELRAGSLLGAPRCDWSVGWHRGKGPR